MEGDPTEALRPGAPAPLSHTSAIRSVETTVAIRLQIALLAWTCPACGQARPRVYHTAGRVRYVKCRRCDTTGKVVP